MLVDPAAHTASCSVQRIPNARKNMQSVERPYPQYWMRLWKSWKGWLLKRHMELFHCFHCCMTDVTCKVADWNHWADRTATIEPTLVALIVTVTFWRRCWVRDRYSTVRANRRSYIWWRATTINTNEYCLSLRLAALLGKSRIEIFSAFLPGWEWLPPFSNHLFFPHTVDGWNPAPPEMYPKLSTGAEISLRYNPSKAYLNLNCRRAKYRNLHPCISEVPGAHSIFCATWNGTYIYISYIPLFAWFKRCLNWCLSTYRISFIRTIGASTPGITSWNPHTSETPTNFSVGEPGAFECTKPFIRDRLREGKDVAIFVGGAQVRSTRRRDW